MICIPPAEYATWGSLCRMVANHLATACDTYKSCIEGGPGYLPNRGKPWEEYKGKLEKSLAIAQTEAAAYRKLATEPPRT